MLIEESESKSNNNNKNSKQSNISSNKNTASTSSENSDFTSITNLHILPNKKINKLLFVSTLFNFLVLFAIVIYSFFNQNYLLNISYIEKNKYSNNKSVMNKDFFSIFEINKYMLYVLIFSLLLFEFTKLIFIFFRKNCRKLGKFVYMEMGYWFIIIKIFYGFDLLFMNFLVFNFYLNFLISSILTVFMIIIIAIFYKKIKEKRNIKTSTLFFVSIYMSLLLAFAIFFLTYNLSEIIYYRYYTMVPQKDEKFLDNLRIILSIISFSLQMFISITFLAYTRDLVFSFTIIYLLVGYFISTIFLSGKAAEEEKISCIVLISVNVISFIYSLCSHKMEAFGVIEDDDVEEVINKMIDQKKFNKEV